MKIQIVRFEKSYDYKVYEVFKYKSFTKMLGRTLLELPGGEIWETSWVLLE